MDTALLNLIKTRQADLDNLKIQLKKDFVGLDEVIEQIVESIKIWYIFPELQIRPTTICLWGLTGVGKTDLVRKLVSYLRMQDRFLELEMAEDSQSTQTIQSKMEDSSLASDEPAILFLDEFQKFRTVDKENEPTENKAYIDVWTLLSDGRFHSDLTKKTELLTELLYSKYYSDYNRVYESKEVKKKDEKDKKRIYKTNVGLAAKVKRLFRLPESLEEIMRFSDEQILMLYEQHAKNPAIYEGEMYKKLLIIISGNLDEAYKIAKDVDEVDMDADWFNEYSKRLTVLDIKKALVKRFRPEQIARFGNNHVLYPSLSKKNYLEVIRLKCKQIGDLLMESKGIQITFDETVVETFYKNGVFPTQGVRPLLSTITNILSCVLPTYIYNCLLCDAKKLTVTSEGNKMTGHFKKKSITLEIPVILDALREKIDDDSKHVVAVHELGHALIYTVLFGVSPAQICTDSISSYAGGFVQRHTLLVNKDNILKTLVCKMAGRAAEELVFGETNASAGAQKDIVDATELAWEYVGKNGFDYYCGAVTSKSNDNDYEIFDRDKISEITEKILKDAKNEAKDLLNKHLEFYRTALNRLLTNGKISPSEFGDIAREFGVTANQADTGMRILLDYKSLTHTFLNAAPVKMTA